MGKRKSLTPEIGSVDFILAEIPDGRQLCLIWCRAHALVTGDDKFRKFIDAFDADKSHHDWTPLEFYCDKAGLVPSELLGVFAKYSHQYASLHIDILKSAHLPGVVRTSYETAKTEKGFDDRTAILKKEGAHFAPQGQTINVNQQTLNATVASHADFTRELEAVTGEPLQLPAATTEFIDAEVTIEQEKELVNR